jgi:hypothetical protein
MDVDVFIKDGGVFWLSIGRLLIGDCGCVGEGGYALWESGGGKA